MRHGWIGVLALVVVPTVCASALRGATSYSVSPLAGPVGSEANVALAISSAGVVGTSTVNNVDYGALWQGSQGSLLPVPSGYRSGALGINASGVVVGAVVPADSSDNTQAVLWQNGQMQALSTPSGFTGEAFAINNSGAIVGQIINPQTASYEAVMWNNGQMTVLGNFPNQQATANAINDNGQVAIEVGPSSYVWSNGSLTAIPSLGGSAVGAKAINNNGTVVGNITTNTVTGAGAGVVYKNGATQLLPSFGDDASTYVRAVNDFDAIVGAGGDDGSAHALIWENGSVYNLNDLIPTDSGWVLQSATGIDNNGDIVGYGMFDNQLQAFELTPLSSPSGSTSVPEPASAATLGVAGLLLLRRRRRA